MSEKDFEDKMKPTTKDVTMSENVYLEMIDDFNDLKQQLQAYKQKEDKLRGLIVEPCAVVLGHDILEIIKEDLWNVICVKV